ncbi:hypothetical protein GQX74_001270, partial [Glossina fuscipes]
VNCQPNHIDVELTLLCTFSEFYIQISKTNCGSSQVKTWVTFHSRKLGLPSKVQPLCCMICDAAQIPQRMQTSKSLLCIYWARKPPQKASPAAVVSTICSGKTIQVSPQNASTNEINSQFGKAAAKKRQTTLKLIP